MLRAHEPATLASGQRTTSVVTLDVTEQHQTQLRSEQLLRDRELMFSLSEVGVAFLRDGVLQRANDSLAVLSEFQNQQTGYEAALTSRPTRQGLHVDATCVHESSPGTKTGAAPNAPPCDVYRPANRQLEHTAAYNPPL